MKLNKNRTTLIILLILSLTSFINSEPTKTVVRYGKFSNIKHQKITLRLKDELVICKNSEEIDDVRIEIFDHDKILKPIKGEVLSCKYFIAVKTGKFEVIFEIKSGERWYDFSPSTLLKEAAYGIFLLNYKTWDVVVSE